MLNETFSVIFKHREILHITYSVLDINANVCKKAMHRKTHNWHTSLKAWVHLIQYQRQM